MTVLTLMLVGGLGFGCQAPPAGPDQPDGRNQPPTVVILSPLEGAVVPLTGPESQLSLEGRATDVEDADECCALE